MQCERCHKKKVAVYYRENRNGRIRALRLCPECAERLEQAGELEDMSTPLSASLSPLLTYEVGTSRHPLPMAKEGSAYGITVCPCCGGSFPDMASEGRMGCPDCYRVFSESLQAPLRILHGGAEHKGRISAGHRAKLDRVKRLAELKEALQAAVAEEAFESAAALRDEIRGLEALL